MSFTGKTVVVTGAGTGIGAAAAKLFLDGGAEVIAVQNNSPAPHATRRVKMSLGDQASIEAAATEMPDRIDVLCNIAGLGADQGTPEQVIGVNYIGARLFTELMLDRVAPTGAILNTSSSAGRNWRRDIDLARQVLAMRRFEDAGPFWEKAGLAHQMSYTLAKEAVVLWTFQLASELAKTGPRVNVLSPGFTDTPMLQRAFAKGNATVSALPLDKTRIAAPEEVARVAVFLCSDAAGVMTGSEVAADAGLTAAQHRDQFGF